MTALSRRAFIASGAAFAAAGAGTAPALGSAESRLKAIRDSLGQGARLGVMAFNTASGPKISLDAGSRFSMCSTFKLPLAAFVLHLADLRRLSLSEELTFSASDLLENSPVSQASVARGRLSVENLAAAAVRQSDNSAANLLLRRTGGPAALTRFIRQIGDSSTRVDRYELALNSNIDGDLRDTTTPAAMGGLTKALLLGPALSAASRRKLEEWLITSVAKPDRLKAGFPASWRVGHKPGTGRNGAFNDVAVAWPVGRPPFIAAVYMSGGTAGDEARAAAHRAIAAIIARQLA